MWLMHINHLKCQCSTFLNADKNGFANCCRSSDGFEKSEGKPRRQTVGWWSGAGDVAIETASRWCVRPNCANWRRQRSRCSSCDWTAEWRRPGDVCRGSWRAGWSRLARYGTWRSCTVAAGTTSWRPLDGPRTGRLEPPGHVVSSPPWSPWQIRSAEPAWPRPRLRPEPRRIRPTAAHGRRRRDRRMFLRSGTEACTWPHRSAEWDTDSRRRSTEATDIQRRRMLPAPRGSRDSKRSLCSS